MVEDLLQIEQIPSHNLEIFSFQRQGKGEKDFGGTLTRYTMSTRASEYPETDDGM